jgi:nitric oxide reductase activation protein
MGEQKESNDKELESQFNKNFEMIKERPEEEQQDPGEPDIGLGRGFTKVNELLAGIDYDNRGMTIKQSEYSEMPQYPSHIEGIDFGKSFNPRQANIQVDLN